MRFKKIFLSFAFLLAASFSFSAQKAVDFSLQDTNGNNVKLSDYKGKVVFLDFWASWCPPCRASIPAIKEMHKIKGTNPDLVILGINSGENASTVSGFMRKNGMHYPVLYGTASVNKDYKITGIPAFFIIDKEGNIAKQYVGYANGMEKEWYKEIDALLK
jgi:Thiol-disulfide isomerase and thioredoxins